MESQLKVFTAFSGYDSQCLALNRLKELYPGKFDYELIGWSEIDKDAIKAHNILFPEAADKNYGDISKVDWKEVPDFDLLTYSSPCFIAGTKILTLTRMKNIEDVKCGDYVYTHNKRFSKVTKTYAKCYKGDLCVVKSGKDNVICTPNHPFYYFNRSENEKEWRAVRDFKLHSKDQLFKVYIMNNEFVHEMDCIDVEKIENIETVVFNLEVEEDHSYVANNFIVHNCTDFSIAGKMAGGEEGSGTRSSLLWECERCIREKRPKYLLFENVTSLVSDKFMPLFKRWCDKVAGYGYTNFYQTLNAKDYGVPQNRDRVFMVSIRNDGKTVDYNFPNPKIPRTCKAENLFEKDVPEDYFLNQSKVDEWAKDNEARIKEFVIERNDLLED